MDWAGHAETLWQAATAAAATAAANASLNGAPSFLVPAAVAHWLRLECGIVGAMVGGVAGELCRLLLGPHLPSHLQCS